ncbi:hypothetical protein BDC45DRAFT_496773 [Circinella umbellata]|nr:hypothetical protein BDC45DRAFT_496773 [Circinella umbellata]
MLLLLLVGIQFSISTYKLMLDGNTYIREQLDDSWQRAYENQNDAVLLEQLQTRLQCQGFANRFDRNMFLTSDNDMDELEPCLNKLMTLFGSGIYAWGVTLWVLKLVQMIGLLGCYSAYLHINQQTDDIEEGERVHEKNLCVTVT